MGALNDILGQLEKKNKIEDRKNFDVGAIEGSVRAGLGQGIGLDLVMN